MTPAPGISPGAQHRRCVLIAASGVLVLSADALLIRLAAAATADVMFLRGALIFLVVGAFALLAALRGLVADHPRDNRAERVAGAA